MFGKMWICVASLLRPGSWGVDICVNYIMLPSGSLAFMSLYTIKEAILGVACLARCIFAPESAIFSMLILLGLGGILI